MKKLIRQNVFETNSSSCHSISVTYDTKLNDIPSPNDDGEIHIWAGEFGWEYSNYSDFGSKSSYLAVYIRDWTSEKLDEFRKIFENLIKEVSGAENIVYDKNFWTFEERSYTSGDTIRTYRSSLGEGYIDHQSVEDNDLHYMFEDVSQMKLFLFSSKSQLTTDNDNH